MIIVDRKREMNVRLDARLTDFLIAAEEHLTCDPRFQNRQFPSFFLKFQSIRTKNEIGSFTFFNAAGNVFEKA